MKYLLIALFALPFTLPAQYTIEWDVEYTVMGGCPTPKPYIDPVTQEVVEPTYTKSIACVRKEEKHLSASFATEAKMLAHAEVLKGDPRVVKIYGIDLSEVPSEKRGRVITMNRQGGDAPIQINPPKLQQTNFIGYDTTLNSFGDTLLFRVPRNGCWPAKIIPKK
ncbi:hypothetical protein LEM8419_03535 [Neolewinella maritima]|uniref:Uncharacterized protein n=1 Tax=Neolewinella maritima TaxID=1383882 RepID=A0ABM9B5J6_9BACT|nr:hypothetical protein [Neolewinella maritima]CAH1002663.1 hypothetical protein LEM8419_03535 [Neolewinella maritima]